MSIELRDRARDDFCEALLAVGPAAPTLCEGWDAAHLAAHVWTLHHDPLAWPGTALPWLAGSTERRLRRAIEGRSYEALVGEIHLLRRIACMPLDGRLEGHRHALGEFVVHTEDVRRANGLPTPAPSPELTAALWRRLRTAARQLTLGRRRGLLLVPTDAGAPPYAVVKGRGTIVTGPVLELMLWVYGRTGHAEVEVHEAS